MKLCRPCQEDYDAWLTSPMIPQNRKQYSSTDRPKDMAQGNLDRHRELVVSQLRLVADICRRGNHTTRKENHND